MNSWPTLPYWLKYLGSPKIELLSHRDRHRRLDPLGGIVSAGRSHPITCVHLGIEYQGEVVRTSRWSSGLGNAPSENSHFKIVILQERPSHDVSETIHRRTAICAPATRAGRQARRIVGEITAAKQAAYLTRRDIDAAAINYALKERQEDLESQLISEESDLFSKGDIWVCDEAGPNPADVYMGGDAAKWMENLAGWLLTRCYPRLPLASQALDIPISEDDVSELFASIFGHAGSDPRLLDRYGPALGLFADGTNGMYDPAECPVFPFIRRKLEGGAVRFDEMYRYLAYDVGLTGQLASLFLALFINHETPEHQIQLAEGAAIFMADGSKFLGTRLTSDLVPFIVWDGLLHASAESIGPASDPSFTDARHHLSLLCPEIGNRSEEPADDTLSDCVEMLGQRIVSARRVLESIKTEFTGDPPDDDAELVAALDRLDQISNDDYVAVYRSLRAGYPSLSGLSDDLETLRQLASLSEDCVEIVESRNYIANAQVPSEQFPNLAVDRETLLTGLSPSRLTRSRGRGWSAVVREAASFKTRYSHVYREHHRKFHDSLPRFQSALAEAKKKSVALELLNTIPELGGPEAVGLEQLLASLPTGPRPCSHPEEDLELVQEPYCPQCRISLAQTVPVAELARLTPQVDQALGQKMQKLSKRLVETALAGRTDERWLEFLQIVQASELSSLANTLDNELVAFIGQVLR